MKFLTFVNYAYIDMAHNLYLQLKKFNRHKDLIITCTDEETKKTLGEQIQNCECEIVQYQPLLFKEIAFNYQSHLNNKDRVATHKKNNSYAVYQFLKHDALYQSLLENERVCLLDADMIIFEDFIDELVDSMDKDHKFYHKGPAIFGFKYYLQIKLGIDLNYPNTLYQWIGREQIINTGFMYVRKSDTTLNHITTYTKLFIPHFDSTINLDEYIITEYFNSININSVSIKDQVNLLSDVGVNYTTDEVLKLKPKTYHPTFCYDKKIEFIKNCNSWLV